MKKLTPDDIEIKSNGIQAKELIRNKYKTIRNFAKVIDVPERRVSDYLRRSSINVESFRIKFRKAFGNPCFNELILSEYNQIVRFANTIFDDIPKYDEEEDLVTFDKVMKLCKEKGLTAEILKMKRNNAMYYLNQNRGQRCIELLEKVINSTYDLKYFNHFLYFNVDLARVYTYIGDYIQAEKILKSIDLENREDTRDDEFRDRALFKYYYFYGLVSNRMRHYDEAISLFQNAIQYTESKIFIGGCITSIGLSYKRKGKLDIALDYYFKSLDIQPSESHITVIYNNIAEVYKQKGEYDTSLSYIELSKDIMIKNNGNGSYLTYVTYLEIEFLKGNTEIALSELMDWTRENNKKRVPKAYILTGIKSMINLAKESKSYGALRLIEDLIMDITYQSKEEAFIKELQTCFGSISMFFYDEDYGGRE